MRHTPDDKITVIYELRDAVEAKVRAEYALAQTDTPEARDALLDATLNVEEKTQDAIEAVLGGVRSSMRRSRLGEVHDNVLDVDFRPERERGWES